MLKSILNDNNDIFILSDSKCSDGDFYYDTRYKSIQPWIDSVQQFGLRGLGWEGTVIFKIETATVNYEYICGKKTYRSKWEIINIINYK